MPAYDGTIIAVRTADDKVINIADITESDANIRATKDETETNEDNKPTPKVDYTKYKDMIKEMKGV